MDGSVSPHHSKRSQRFLISAAIIIFALTSAYLALVIVTRVDSIFSPGKQITLPGVFNKAPLIDAKGDSGPKDRINILVMGLDRRPREGETPTRTDSLFIVTVDPKTKSTGILGIPRDFQVDIPSQSGGTYQDRINTVYVAGELGKYPGGGVGLMKQVVQNELKIKIDKYVIIDFKGFESVVDELGGIDVDVPDEVYDPYYSETEAPGDYLPQHFYPGTQHMDGQTALAYSRIRFSSDDLDRIQRQQRVIFAAIDKANSINVLKRADSLWSKYKDAVHTDISDFQIPGYALLASDVKDNIHAVSLGPAMYPYTDPRSGAEVLLGNSTKIKQIVESIFSQQGEGAQPIGTPEPVRVQVQNGTGTEGLAARVVAYIAGKGYSTNDLTSANVFDGAAHNESVILDIGGSHRSNAFLLANWLNIPPASVRDASAVEKAALAGDSRSEAPLPEIVVVLGSDLDFNKLIQSPTTSVSGG